MPHNVKWTSFAPPGWTNFAPPLTRIQLIKALFQHTLVDFLAGYKAKKNLVIHMDADLYSSTLYCLATLDPVLDGTIVIFAVFDNLSHEYSAFQDYVRSFRRSYEVIARYGYYKNRHFPDSLQIHGNHTQIAPPL